jgi:hypothetical protein
MKRIVSMAICLIMLFSITSFAKEDVSTNVVTVSEYDAIKDVIGKNSTELVDMGYTKEQSLELLENLKETENTIRSLMTYDAGKLKELGYNQKQIKSLKLLNNSLSSTKAFKDISQNTSILINRAVKGIFGSVSMECIKPVKMTGWYLGRIKWQWSGKPLMMIEEGIGIAWDSGFRAESKQTIVQINYVDGHSAGTKYNFKTDIEVVPGAGLKVKFPPNRQDVYKPGTTPAWAKSGEIGFKLTNPTNSSSIQMVAKYGHTTIGFGIGIDIKGTPNVGFSLGTETMAKTDDIFEMN